MLVDRLPILVFWACFGLVFYAYVLYPALAFALSRLCGRPNPAAVPGPDGLPHVSLLLAAYDEETVLADRLEGAIATDYPAGLFEVVVGSDGSTDGTAAIARSFADRGVRLLDFPERRGKAAVLNDAILTLRGEIVVLSDANTLVDPRAVSKLVRHFARPEVGAVCGRLVLVDSATGRNADGLYWRYETFIKKCEARLGALLGANGAIYAIRRDLYVPIPAGTIIDDFVIPLLAKIRHGCQLVYEAEATAVEETAPDIAAEFRRRARIGAGGFQSLGLLWPLLNPLRGWVAWAFWSHKVLRWLCPLFLIGMIAANLAMIGSPPWRWVLAAQATFYAMSVAVPSTAYRLPWPLRLASMFTSMNAALLVGFFLWASGRNRGTWRPTARANPVAANEEAR